MLMLPDALDGEHLAPIRPYVIYVQSKLLQAQVFHVLPHGALHPQNPRTLPREVVEEGDAAMPLGKKKGRPSKRARTQRAREALAALEGCGGAVSGAEETRVRYGAARGVLTGGVDGDAVWARASAAVDARVSVLI